MAKRAVGIFFCMILCFALLVLRLFYLTQDSRVKQSGVAQGSKTVELSQSRGMIYDCNLDPIVNLDSEDMLAVRPGREAAAALLSDEMEAKEREDLLARLADTSPFVISDPGTPLPQTDSIRRFSVRVRYPTPFFFAHAVGYVDYAGKGVSGIEKACDAYLWEHGTSVEVSFPTNASGTPLQNRPIRVDAEREDPQGVVLSLDSTLQRAAHYAAKERIEKGAVLIMDAQTGDLKAMASFPDYDPNRVAQSLTDPDSPMINRCTYAYNLGSIFKIVTAACALENGWSTDWSYDCKGYIDVEGQIFRCHHLAGHGEQDMWGAMQVSCNPYFIALSLELGAVRLYETAYRLGFGQYCEFAPGMFGSSGSLPKPYDIRYDAQLANIGFGQGELLATPLQVAALLSAVANGGERVSPALLLGYSDEEGRQLEQLHDRPDKERVLSEQTARILRQMLIQVVEEGSGKEASPLHGGAGGKTGSAQTGLPDENGEEIVQAWFAGFYPAEDPRYAIVVFVEGGESGALQAAPVFKELCDYIYIYEMAGE